MIVCNFFFLHFFSPYTQILSVHCNTITKVKDEFECKYYSFTIFFYRNCKDIGSEYNNCVDKISAMAALVS